MSQNCNIDDQSEDGSPAGSTNGQEIDGDNKIAADALWSQKGIFSQWHKPGIFAKRS
jgi:hypothetical protein